MAVMDSEVVHVRILLQRMGVGAGAHRDGGPHQVSQLLERARFHRAAGADDRDVVAELLHLGEDVTGQQHRGTEVGDLFDTRSETPSPSTGPGPRSARRECRARRWWRTRPRSPPSADCPSNRCAPSCAGRVRTARSAGRGVGCRLRCHADGPESRWPEGRSGWATTSHRRARRRCVGATPPRRARDRRRAAGRFRRRRGAGRAALGWWWTCPHRSARENR